MKISHLLLITGSVFFILPIGADTVVAPAAPSIENPSVSNPVGVDGGYRPPPKVNISCSLAQANLQLIKTKRDEAASAYDKLKKESEGVLRNVCDSYITVNRYAHKVAGAKTDVDSMCNSGGRSALGITPPLLVCDPACSAFNADRTDNMRDARRSPPSSCSEAKEQVAKMEDEKIKAKAEYDKKKQNSDLVVENMCKQYLLINQLTREANKATSIKDIACHGNDKIFIQSAFLHDPVCKAVLEPSTLSRLANRLRDHLRNRTPGSQSNDGESGSIQ